MIPEQWYPVLESRTLGRRPQRLRRLGRDWVAWRDGAGVARLLPRHCPHRGAGLEGGRVVDGELECPWHGFRFDGTGRCTTIPCNGPDARIPAGMDLSPATVCEEHELIWLWHGTPGTQRPPVPWFEGLGGKWAGMGYDLPYHYSRMVETNLDFHHTPFTHKRVLGLPFGSVVGELVSDFHAERKDGLLHTRGELRRHADRAGTSFRIDMRMPCLVELQFGGFRLFVTSTPIDEGSTWLYARYYHPRSKLLCRAMILGELWAVQPQDWAIFETLPEGTIDDVDYRMVRADEGIALYRRWRRELLEAAARTSAA